MCMCQAQLAKDDTPLAALEKRTFPIVALSGGCRNRTRHDWASKHRFDIEVTRHSGRSRQPAESSRRRLAR